MTLKIILYILIIFGTLFLERYYGLLQRIIFPDLLFVLIILCPYLLLLFFEIRGNAAKNIGYKELKKSGFIFSFWVGFSWGVLISFSRGFPKFNTLGVIILNLLGYGLTGAVIGFVGMGVTIIFLRYIFNISETK
jgi:hypothetical protein